MGLKPYRTWEVREFTGEKTQWTRNWYVHEKNPKKWRNSFHECYGFDTQEEAEACAEEFRAKDMENEKKKAARRAERAAARKALKNPFKVGMIFSNSWGYDQTNVDYYQVTRVTPKGVYLRAIGAKAVQGSEGFMCEKRVPARDAFTGPEHFKPILAYGTYGEAGEAKVYIAAEHGSMHLLEGDWEATYASWYA